MNPGPGALVTSLRVPDGIRREGERVERTAIRAGVVYAVTVNAGDPEPVVFLEPEAAGLWEERHCWRLDMPVTFRQIREDEHTRAGKAGLLAFPVGDRGYLVARPWRPPEPGEDRLAALRGLDPAAELERARADKPPSSRLLAFDVVTALDSVSDWDEAVRAAEQYKKADRAWYAGAEALAGRVDGVVTRLQELGVAAEEGASPGTVELGIEAAEKLLARLGGNDGPGTRRERGPGPEPGLPANGTGAAGPAPGTAAGHGSPSSSPSGGTAGRGTARPSSHGRSADRHGPGRP